MRIYDLTATFSPELPVYGGDPGVEITEYYAMSRGQSCNVSRLSFGSHTGTHADVPKHFVDDGATCDTVALSQFCGPAKVFDLRRVLEGRRVIERNDLETLDINAGDIVLFNTGNSPLMRERDFHPDYVSLSPEAALYLADKPVKTIGIDYLSVEAYGSKGHKTHLALLGKGVTIIEGLVFDNEPIGFVPQGTYMLSALPLKIKNGNGSPVRAVLMDDRKLDLAIFDMDGLLIDTEPISMAGWHEAGRQLGYVFPPALFDRLFGCGLKLCKERMDAHFGPGFDFEAAYAARTTYVRAYIEEHGVAVKPGLHTLLDRLDAYGIKKCVATSTDYERAKYLLTRCGIFDRFERVIAGDSITHGKPNPEIFLTAAHMCDTKPENCVVLEDSATGAEAGYHADMRVILVPDLSKPDARTLGRVSAVCKDLTEAADIITFLKNS